MDERTEIVILPEAARAVGAVVDRIAREAWDAPSPCAGWSVRDVLNHLTSEHLWAPHLLRGETLGQVGDRYDGDVLGQDPAGAWRRAVAGSMLAFGTADPAAPVHVSFGQIGTREYASQMLVDLTVHAWDLARGASVPYAEVPDAVEAAFAYEKPRVQSHAAAGIFAPPVATPSPSRLDQLVALLGRDPEWSSRV